MCTKKLFNNEDEFGIIPNKRLYESRIQGENDAVMNFFGSEALFRQVEEQSIYKSFSIYI
ncbi:hypothetical protein HR10_10020 [Porphyromonas gulae]|nr:hypothetical protein HR10_10020 [Porphyromonas gulae]